LIFGFLNTAPNQNFGMLPPPHMMPPPQPPVPPVQLPPTVSDVELDQIFGELDSNLKLG